MPIKGLSETRRLPRLGHLRLGVKKTNAAGKEYPAKTDHFVVDFPDNPDIEAEFKRIYGDKPTRVTVAFASNDPEQIFPQWYQCYGAGSGLKCRGNGETAGRADGEGNIDDVDCPGPGACDFGQANKCAPHAVLSCFVKGLSALKVVQVSTGSKNSIINVNSGIDLMRTALQQNIAGRWIDLCLKPQASTVDGKATQIYVLEIEIPCSLDLVQQLESAFEPRAALGHAPKPAALPAPEARPEPVAEPVSVWSPEQIEQRRKHFRAACELSSVEVVGERLKSLGYEALNSVPPDVVEEVLEQLRYDTLPPDIKPAEAEQSEIPGATQPTPTPTTEPEIDF